MSNDFDFLGIGSLLGGITNLGSTIYNAINGKKERKEDQVRQDTALQRNAADAAAIGINPLTASGFGGSDSTVSSTGNIDTTNLSNSLNNLDTVALQKQSQNLAQEQLNAVQEQNYFERERTIETLELQKKQLDATIKQNGINAELQAESNRINSQLANLKDSQQKFEKEKYYEDTAREQSSTLKSDMDKIYKLFESNDGTDSSKGGTITSEGSSSTNASIKDFFSQLGASLGIKINLSDTEAQKVTSNFLSSPDTIKMSRQSLTEICSLLDSGKYHIDSVHVNEDGSMIAQLVDKKGNTKRKTILYPFNTKK